MSAAPAVAERQQLNEDYQQLLTRFDQLWETASSPQDQREMQELLIRINRHEAGRCRESSTGQKLAITHLVSPNPQETS
jgi:hypothetical protein